MNSFNQKEREARLSLFTHVYQEQQQPVFAYLLGQSGNRDVALDTFQETFLRVWQHIDDLEETPPERRRFWLFTVARNVLTDHWRRQDVRRRHEMPGLEDLDLASPSGEMEDIAMHLAIEQLPEPLRTTLMLSVLGNMNSNEIGEVMLVPASTVRSRLAEARRQLIEFLRLTKTPEKKKIEPESEEAQA